MASKLRAFVGLALIFALLGSVPGSASSTGYVDLPGWHWISGGGIAGVSFINNMVGWAVGGGGLIIHTTNAGLSWTPQTSGIKSTLQDVQFLDNDHGWAAGDGGVILATDDGGVTWVTQTTPTSEYLYRVYFVNTNYGWAVGDNGTILTTQNGGLLWTSQTSNTTETLYGVDFVDTTHGWSVGANGTVIATTNGGSTWNDQPSCDEIHALYDVDFVDQNNGWIVGWGSALWTTSNGGTNWGEWILSGWTRNLYSLELSDANHGWAVGDGGFIARYAYPSWTELTSGTDATLYNLDFVNDQQGWIVGSAGTVLSTTDGGNTWVHRIESADMTVNGMYFIDRNRGWAVTGASIAGFPGEILYTSDGGKSWGVQKSGIPYMNDVQFITEHRGWAVGGLYGSGTILSTIDGGVNWDSQTYPVGGPMHAVQFTSPDDGWAVGGAVGGNGWILKTINAGSDWTLEKTIYSTAIHDVCFSDFYHGWAVGVNGNIWATVNASDWFTQTSGITETIKSVYCYDQYLWAVSDNTIIASLDGGNNWSTKNHGFPDVTFMDMDFVGPAWGWVVGSDDSSSESLILASGDLGNTWLEEETPIDAGLLYSVHSFRHGEGPVIWAGGINGLLLSNRPSNTVPVTGTVTAADGGDAFSGDGSTTIRFPTGAVTSTVIITHTPMSASQLPSTGQLTGYRMFDLTAVYSSTGNPASLAPGASYTITVDYSGSFLIEDSQLGLYYWNGSAWVMETTSSADFFRNTVTANPDHLSYFAVLGKSYAIYLPIVIR
ncbi:MAG: hypothetical protein JW908_03390 [Anaerolineales bacterium]|nr:hypothetical protein [Anaerolineales bacterium]